MITPAYSPTATERVLPRMALDFTTASLDPRVTVTRALNTATAVNSSGFITIVNADLPRFDYDPSTLLCKGLLIEESRQNRVLRSNDFANAAWDDGAPNNATVTVNLVSPSGSTDGATLTAATGGTVSLRRQAITAPGATTYAFSIFVKKGTATSSRFLVRDNTNGTNFIQMTALTWSGTVPVLGGTTGTWTSVPWRDGWYRLIGVGTTGAGASISLAASVFPDNAAGTGTLGVYGVQIEAGAFATSYIPTTTTSLTRNADVVTMTGTNFSSWFNATEGTFSIDCTINTRSAAQILMEMSDGTSANRIQYQRDTGSNILSYVAIVSSSITVNLQKASAFVNDTASITAAYKLDDYGVAVNGGATTTDTSSGVPTVDRMRIGATVAGTALSNGWYQKIFYYPQRLTNSEIQAFSK